MSYVHSPQSTPTTFVRAISNSSIYLSNLTMDWFSWLSKTSLHPSLIHDYGLSFSQNQLEHEDISYFNHEFLQSMGISIAKHRLEILKLAHQHRNSPPLTSPSISRLVNAIRKSGKCFSEYLRAWIRREESSQALVVLPKPKRSSSASGRWKGGFMKRNKRSVMPSNGNGGFEKQERLLLTNGTPCRLDTFSSPLLCDYSFKEEKLHSKDCDWGNGGNGLEEEIRWDSMFQNLKPT